MGAAILLNPAVAQVAERFLADLPYVVALPVTLLLLLILSAYTFGRASWRRLYAAIFLFMANFSLWMMGNSNLLMALLPSNRAFLEVFSALMLYLLPVTANLVVLEVMEKPAQRKAMRVVYFYAWLFAIAALLESRDMQGFRYTRLLYYLSLPVLEGYIFLLLYRSARGGNRYSRAMLLPLCSLTGLGILDGVNAFLHLTPLPVYVMPLGVLSFLYFVLQLIRDQMLREKTLADHTATLEYRAALAQVRAETDELTLCRNRLAFDEELRREILSVRQSGRPLGCLLFDIDHFKKFNDTYGHEAGDAVLKNFARTVREQLDKEKPFFRWGGEEFVVLLPGLDLDDAALLGCEIRRKVADTLRYEETPVTASVGLSVWHGALDTAERFFARADAALYRAKAAGRNTLRVELPPDAAEGMVSEQ